MNECKPIYKVGIIGCGSIGALKPDHLDDPAQDDKILTHAHAVTKHPRTVLGGVVDEDMKKIECATNKWGTVGYVWPIRYGQLQDNDIIIVATPTTTHAKVITAIVKEIKPKLIIAEKPFCSNIHEAIEMCLICKDAGVPIAVNYMRAFIPEIKTLLDRIRKGYIYDTTFMYGRGIMHDGCHAVQFLEMLYQREPKVVSVHPVVEDHMPGDPTVNVSFDYGHTLKRCGTARMLGIDSHHYGLFDTRIVTSEGVFDLVDNGAKVIHRPAQIEKVYGDYLTLSSHNESRDIPLHTGLMSLLDNCVDYLDGTAPLMCTDVDALKVHTVIKEIRRKVHEQVSD